MCHNIMVFGRVSCSRLVYFSFGKVPLNSVAEPAKVSEKCLFEVLIKTQCVSAI